MFSNFMMRTLCVLCGINDETNVSTQWERSTVESKYVLADHHNSTKCSSLLRLQTGGSVRSITPTVTGDAIQPTTLDRKQQRFRNLIGSGTCSDPAWQRIFIKSASVYLSLNLNNFLTLHIFQYILLEQKSHISVKSGAGVSGVLER